MLSTQSIFKILKERIAKSMHTIEIYKHTFERLIARAFTCELDYFNRLFDIRELQNETCWAIRTEGVHVICDRIISIRLCIKLSTLLFK